MRGLAQLYIQQFRTTMTMMFQYRASLVIWMIGQILEPLIYLVVWTVVATGSGGNVGAFSTRQFAGYYLVLMLVNQVTYTWIMYEFEYRIREGILSFALLKPVHPIHSDIADNVSSKMITLPIILLAALVLSLFFHPSLAPAPWAIVLFIPALLLAFLVRFLFEWTLAQAAFWTTRVGAINQSYFVLMLFMSGQIAPLELLPLPVRVAATALPFRWMIGFPVELLLGRLTLGQALVGLAAQAAWIVGGYLLLRVVWRAGLKAYGAVGA